MNHQSQSYTSPKDKARPSTLTIPIRRRTASLGGLNQFRAAISGNQATSISPTISPASASAIGSSRVWPVRENEFLTPPASASSTSSFRDSISESPSKKDIDGTGNQLNAFFRRSSWIEGSSTNKIGSPPGNHFYSSLPSRTTHPGLFGSNSQTSPIGSVPLCLYQGATTAPDATAGSTAMPQPQLQQSRTHIAALGIFRGAVPTDRQERPNTPMGDMILSGQFLD